MLTFFFPSGYPKYGWWQKWYPEETWGLEYAQVNLDKNPPTIDPATTEDSYTEGDANNGPDTLDLESAEEFPGNEVDDDVGPDEIDSAASFDAQDDQDEEEGS